MIKNIFLLSLMCLITGTSNAQLHPVSREIPDDINVIKNITYAEYTLKLDFYQVNNASFQLIPERSLKLDLYSPLQSEEALPAIVAIRAGGGGDKEMAAPIAAALAQKGFITISIEYRWEGEATFPAAIHDIKAAVRWLRANAATRSMKIGNSILLSVF
ncbi:alpha/beta hydrolase [Gammaproteobacteria bacterium]|nr:alpha/beta hydrolase [Gammaproteobacteria bacterium]